MTEIGTAFLDADDNKINELQLLKKIFHEILLLWVMMSLNGPI